MHKGIHIEDEGTDYLAGSPEPSSRPAALGSAVILLFPFPPRDAAAEWAWEEEASSFDDPVSIGELAVRIVARSMYPRIHCEVWEGEPGEESPPSL